MGKCDVDQMEQERKSPGAMRFPGYRIRLCPGTAWVASSPGALGAAGPRRHRRHGDLDARAGGSGLETQGHHFCADHLAQLRLNIFICKMGTNMNTLFPGL